MGQALGTTPSITLLVGVAPPTPPLSSAPIRMATVPVQRSTASVPVGLFTSLHSRNRSQLTAGGTLLTGWLSA